MSKILKMRKKRADCWLRNNAKRLVLPPY